MWENELKKKKKQINIIYSMLTARDSTQIQRQKQVETDGMENDFP